MTTEEVYEALNLQLQQQEIENRLARMELRNELTENNRVISDMAQAIDRWIGSSEPTTPVFNAVSSRALQVQHLLLSVCLLLQQLPHAVCF
jgi:hypothetical protein